ncbi:MAG TPA: PEP-CTERM sorting domain-containing protein [Tepidisphaeraceae bacterium]|jgi:hypothetical protein
MFPQKLSFVTAVTAAATLAALAGTARGNIGGFNSGVGYTANSSKAPAPTFTATTATLTQLGVDNQAASVFFNTKQDISTGFTAQFTYQLTAVGENGYTDGFTFTIQNASPDALGQNGAGLGFRGIASSVAVAFDQNEGGARREVTKAVVGPGYSDGDATPVAPVAFASGHPINVTLAYSAATGNIVETLVDQTTLATFTTTFSGFNIANSVGGPDAFIGFTAGVGGGSTSGTQVISNFSFTAVPEPTSLAALAAGGLVLLRRRRAAAL